MENYDSRLDEERKPRTRGTLLNEPVQLDRKRCIFMTHGFRYYLRVRYGECDAQKVVFNARYADYVDLVTTEFLRALGQWDVMVAGRFDYQLVKQTLEWKAPARFDQVLELTLLTKHLGNTSFTLGVEFRIAGEGTMVM